MTAAGRSTTSPAAIWLATVGSRMRIVDMVRQARTRGARKDDQGRDGGGRKALGDLCPSPPPLQVERLGNGLCCTLPPDAKVPDVSNRLAHESSLYLRQHEANPVHWWPWCDEAFAEAKAKDKPVLVSVGYSSCHWCHVMARESFEQAWVADLMNQHFVCIKVDREERPEVDKLMMDAVQMIQGHGGWPLNCFCLPDGRPFFGGTYFPPEDRGHGQVPWPQLLMRVSDFYHRNKSELAANADAIAQNLTHLTRAPDADGSAPSPEDLIAAARRICEQHDDTFGGFGAAPKFPAPHTLNFLLGLRGAAAVESDRALASRIDAVLTITLGSMARGGLFDQVGGGFHRYCVDRDWTVPHFEKMLYDNAQLLGTYAEAWARYRDPLYADVCAETVGWLLREMRTSNGLFAASLDADTDHHEGTTYVWTAPEVAAALGDEAFAFAQAYGLSDKGNFEGKNIPKLKGDHAARVRFAGARAKLLALRDRRPQPARDDKNLLSWNALVVGNLAKAAWIFDRKDWSELALETEANLWARFALGDGDGLRSVAHGDKVTLEGNLSDYAWFAEAELALAEGLVRQCRARRQLLAAPRLRPDPDALRGHALGARVRGPFHRVRRPVQERPERRGPCLGRHRALRPRPCDGEVGRRLGCTARRPERRCEDRATRPSLSARLPRRRARHERLRRGTSWQACQPTPTTSTAKGRARARATLSCWGWSSSRPSATRNASTGRTGSGSPCSFRSSWSWPGWPCRS
ncbi:MAG: thioredoxin domain-containing protein [Verrucomicrobia bacterium]|nr:thioredoxin domain-containing protein [Verrucomicrobiota bacterium]